MNDSGDGELESLMDFVSRIWRDPSVATRDDLQLREPWQPTESTHTILTEILPVEIEGDDVRALDRFSEVYEPGYAEAIAAELELANAIKTTTTESDETRKTHALIADVQRAHYRRPPMSECTAP